MKNEALIKMASARKKLEENPNSILFAKIGEPYGGIMKVVRPAIIQCK